MLDYNNKFRVSRRDTGEFLSFTITNFGKKNQFRMRINLGEPKDSLELGQKYSLSVSSITASLDPSRVDKSKDYYLKEKSTIFEAEVLKMGKALPTRTVSRAISITKTTTTVSSHIGTILGVTLTFTGNDPQAVILRFTQYLRFLKRVKLIGEFFGVSLEALIEALSPDEKKTDSKYQKPSLRLLELSLTHNLKMEVEENSSGVHNKLDLFMISVFFEGPLMTKTLFYDLSWVLRIIGMIFLARMKQKKKIVNWKLHYLKYQKKIHFISLMSGAMDIYFFGTRILLHRTNSTAGVFVKMVCAVNICLITFDLLEMMRISLGVRFEDKIKENKARYTPTADN